MILRTLFLFLVIPTLSWSDAILVPMDDAQTNHLKAYGVAYWALQEPRVYKSEWLLNYRGGSF